MWNGLDIYKSDLLASFSSCFFRGLMMLISMYSNIFVEYIHFPFFLSPFMLLFLHVISVISVVPLLSFELLSMSSNVVSMSLAHLC